MFCIQNSHISLALAGLLPQILAHGVAFPLHVPGERCYPTEVFNVVRPPHNRIYASHRTYAILSL
jgi:hypothetical protein